METIGKTIDEIMYFLLKNAVFPVAASGTFGCFGRRQVP